MATKKNDFLKEFHSVDAIPAPRRTTWATNVLDEFLKSKNEIMCAEYETDRKAMSKQTLIKRALDAENSEYVGKVKVERRGNAVYIAKL